MFASDSRKDIAFGDERVTIKKLNHVSLGRARDVKSGVQIKGLRDLGGDILKALREEDRAQKAAEKSLDPETVRKARLDSFDRNTILQLSIVGWTLSSTVKPEQIEDLTEDVAQRIFEEAVEFALGPINVKDREEAAKNA